MAAGVFFVIRASWHHPNDLPLAKWQQTSERPFSHTSWLPMFPTHPENKQANAKQALPFPTVFFHRSPFLALQKFSPFGIPKNSGNPGDGWFNRWQSLHPDARDLVERLLRVPPIQRRRSFRWGILQKDVGEVRSPLWDYSGFIHGSPGAEIPPKTNIDIQNDGFWKKPGLDKDLSWKVRQRNKFLCWRTFCNKKIPWLIGW